MKLVINRREGGTPGGSRASEVVVQAISHRRRRLVPLVLTATILAGCAGTASDTSTGTTAPDTTSSGESTTSAVFTTSTSDPDTSTTAAPTTATTAAPTTAAPSTTAAPTTVAPTTIAAPTTTAVPVDPTLLPEPAGPLQAGSKGARTQALQQALRDQKYDPGEIDGAFGGQVTMAVWAYQSLHGLPKDGLVTPELEARILAKAPQAMLKPELGPTHTEVDLSRQVLIVWRDGAPALITHVSSGSEVAYCEDTDEGQNCGDAVTPTGVYKYERRIDGWRDAPLGRLYKPVYFKGGIAVHGAPSVPNRPASHGCVRIPMPIAEYFPGLVANGDTIEVFRS